MRIVLDTNVVISALIWGGTPYKLIEAAVDSDVVLCTSPALLDELRAVLAREHLAVRLERQQSAMEAAVALYAALTITVFPTEAPPVVQEIPTMTKSSQQPLRPLPISLSRGTASSWHSAGTQGSGLSRRPKLSR